MKILNISNFKKELSYDILFEYLNLVIDNNDKKGAGKSTLLKMIIGKYNTTDGSNYGK